MENEAFNSIRSTGIIFLLLQIIIIGFFVLGALYLMVHIKKEAAKIDNSKK
jgi:flagellar basal body-associated protein FliL